MEEEGSTLLGTCRFDLKHFFPVVNYSLCKRVRQKSGSVLWNSGSAMAPCISRNDGQWLKRSQRCVMLHRISLSMAEHALPKKSYSSPSCAENVLPMQTF